MDSNMGFSDEVMEEIGISYAGIREIRLLEREITTLNRKINDLECELYHTHFKTEMAKDELERVNSLWFNKVYNFFYTLRFRNPFYHR